jgi:hypothetical protein
MGKNLANSRQEPGDGTWILSQQRAGDKGLAESWCARRQRRTCNRWRLVRDPVTTVARQGVQPAR